MLNKFFALFFLILLSPLFLIIIIFLYGLSGPPIFYKHSRYGYKFKEFKIYKFRTMISNDGPIITYTNDNRITGIGKMLRKYKLDELPQIINVLKGDMNIIGPRPEVIKLVNKYSDKFNYLNSVKPGISDISSIIFKNEAEILSKNEINKYEEELLPIKSQIVIMQFEKSIAFSNLYVIILSIIAILNHKLSLHIISKLFLPYNNKEFRMKLNYLLSVKIF